VALATFVILVDIIVYTILCAPPFHFNLIVVHELNNRVKLIDEQVQKRKTTLRRALAFEKAIKYASSGFSILS